MNHNHQQGLGIAFWLTLAFAGVELVGGFVANSLALLADAWHMLSDVAALGLAMLAGRIAMRPAHETMTYGYGRARLLAAQFNGLMLWFLCGWIIWEAVDRLQAPPAVQGSMVLWIAAAGLALNLLLMRFLHADAHHDINMRAAYWHVLGDALGSVAAIVAGLVIMHTGWMMIDPLLSLLVAGILAWGGWRLVRDTSMELMEAVPPGIKVRDVQQILQDVEGVNGLHHIHLWRLPGGALALSAHVELNDMQHWPELLPVLLEQLKQQGIEHATLQAESSGCQK